MLIIVHHNIIQCYVKQFFITQFFFKLEQRLFFSFYNLTEHSQKILTSFLAFVKIYHCKIINFNTIVQTLFYQYFLFIINITLQMVKFKNITGTLIRRKQLLCLLHLPCTIFTYLLFINYIIFCTKTTASLA